MTATEYIKEKWGDNWLRNSWEPGDVIDALEEFAETYHKAKMKEITDADIEVWAEEEIERQRKGFKAINDELPISFDSWMEGLKHCKIISAKALRDGNIKHIES